MLAISAPFPHAISVCARLLTMKWKKARGITPLYTTQPTPRAQINYLYLIHSGNLSQFHSFANWLLKLQN